MSSLKMAGKTAAVMIAAVMCLAQGVLAQGPWNCGPAGDRASVKATYDNGTLTISGSGDMAKYVWDLPSSWYDDYHYRNNITAVIIEDGVTSVAGDACYGCENLTAVTIGENVTSIGMGAFSYCVKLTDITIGSNITEIGAEAFFGSGLTAVTIPNGVISIGDGAFSSCPNLAAVTIGENTVSIGKNAFFGCENLNSINVAQTNKSYSSENGVLFNKAKDTLIQYPANKAGAYEIPNGVIEIGEDAFRGSGLTAVTIPNSVKTIEKHAFLGCEKLTAIDIPNSVTKIGEGAFSDAGLTSITIPNSVKLIGEWAFSDNDHLITANIMGFGGTIIDRRAFNGCINLAAVVIGDGVTVIRDYAFGYCGRLTTITVGRGVTSILNNVFVNDNRLEEIKFSAAEPPAITDSTFSKIDKANVCLRVPQGSAAKYELAWGLTWDDFACKSEWEPPQSIISRDRVPVPPSGNNPLLAVVAAGEFAVGPNPVAKSEGKMNFFRQGGQLENTTLFIYDASGNLVKKITIADKSKNRTDKRAVGTWDLKDAKGRAVSEGSYVVKGAIKTKDGKKEKISLVVGVR